MNRFFTLAVPVILTAAFGLFAHAEAMNHKSNDGHEMTMHHQHILMGHGLSMVLEGSNMVMLGGMKMSDSLDPLSVEHGKMMIANGKALIERGLSGPEMMAMHNKGKGPGDDPAMQATHDLGESILKMVGLLEKMETGSMGDHGMEMHHMHVLINHGLGMAVQGANLAMVGDMRMAGGIDPPTVEHGRKMIANGKALIDEIMKGDAMMNMHNAKVVPSKDPMMKHTHSLTETAYKIIGHLEKMLASK